LTKAVIVHGKRVARLLCSSPNSSHQPGKPGWCEKSEH